MDRQRAAESLSTRRNPHARGDGPAVRASFNVARPKSPRAWGWTVGRVALQGAGEEIPTRVGMDRAMDTRVSASQRNPHARGDGPSTMSNASSTASKSPRAWGWTGQPARGVHPGDGPRERQAGAGARSKSPRVWGRTVNHDRHRCGRPEIPTRVGMDRWDHAG